MSLECKGIDPEKMRDSFPPRFWDDWLQYVATPLIHISHCTFSIYWYKTGKWKNYFGSTLTDLSVKHIILSTFAFVFSEILLQDAACILKLQ